MKLQIKTLNQKTLLINIEETKSVYELKKVLSLYPDVGVEAEQQKLIYSGKILENDNTLSFYNIDEKKFIVIMISKQPLMDLQKASTSKQTQNENADTSGHEQKEEGFKDAANQKSTTRPATSSDTVSPKEQSGSRKENLVKQIVGMGYPEYEVRKALASSFYNPERAIEYLVEGVPNSSSEPEGDNVSKTDTDLSMTAFEMFRGEPSFQRLRGAMQRNPELVDLAIQRIARTNPHLINLIRDNESDFFASLIDSADNEVNYDDFSLED